MSTIWKEDSRPQRGAWAPGSYLSRCHVCQEQFIGDKRAYSCADCAYGLPQVEPDRELGFAEENDYAL